jgi:hypothetical protein
MVDIRLFVPCVAALLALSATLPTYAQVAGKSGDQNLAIAGGATPAVVVVSAEAGEWERRAAADLALYAGKLTGGPALAVADTPDAAQVALNGGGPVLVVGTKALELEPALRDALARVAKPNPLLRADAIVVRRAGNRVYLAGTGDDAHYYAVSHLLHAWGCRWYLPTEFGECVPRHASIAVGELDLAYAPPFEVRRYWLSWNGDPAGKPEFMRRNFFNDVLVPSGHNLAQFTKELEPPGKGHFAIPITDPRTADHVARQVLPIYAAGKDVQLGMEDGTYTSDHPLDKELLSLQWDKYFMTPSYTDCFMTFYNNVAERLMAAAPQSTARVGFLAYGNLTIPPVRVTKGAKPLVAYLAPIDIDPNHGMDDPRSAPRREYKEHVYNWSKVMDGRVVIYDYDQGMLVWRDLPNPSHMMFRHDVKHYAKAGVLGVDTESRGATATTFLNLFLRGQLMWNPQADVDALLAEFYPAFYGPAAAAPMAAYWGAVFKAWEDTIVTEHEYFVAPAIYTPQLVETMRKHLADAEQAVQAAAGQAEGKAFVDRVRFTRLSFDVTDAYMQMTRAAGTEVDYAAAVAAGKRGLARREELTAMNGTFTTYKNIPESGYAWWPGEVQQYEELLPFTAGPKGQLVAKLPLDWAFRRDPDDAGAKEGWENQAPDLTWRNGQSDPRSVASRQANPGQWELVRSDVYLQAQGLVTPESQSYTGHGWYHAEVELTAEQAAGDVHVRFPGLFNECWLYVNGEPAGHREFKGVWWLNDYRFEWDVPLAGKLKPGKNAVVLRIFNPHHMGGMFRRPFLYRATGQ